MGLSVHVDLAEGQEAGPFLYLVLQPDRDVLVPASGALSGASSDLAKDVGSLFSADMQFESAATECSSQDDRVYEELIKAVTRSKRPPDASSQTTDI